MRHFSPTCCCFFITLMLAWLAPACLAQQTMPLASSEADHLSQLGGTVTDASGAVIAGATVQIQSEAGTVLRTARSDANGAFALIGLPAGDYRLVVSSTGFESKEIPVTIRTAKAAVQLRISLVVSGGITTVNVEGRADDLIGIASSAGQVTVGAEELKNRPLLRTGEILEALPGLIITQHAGGGKANQYFLRGFNLDHGTDFAIFLDGMPLNLPSHAHGEGYSDMNIVIPEFVERIDAQKGPYYADVGDYGSAGNAHVVFYKTLPRNFVQVDGGMYQFARFVFGVSRKWARGNLLYGGEAYHDGGPWVHPDNYYKFNGLMTYSRGSDDNGFSLTARGYAGTRWNSSDQLPYTALVTTPPAGQFGNYTGFFGTLDSTDGGHSHRYSLQGEWHRRSAYSATQIMAYGFYYDLNLFSDFTYYLVDPYKGDQFEQQDRRWVGGFDLRHTINGKFLGRKAETTFGMQLRNDWIHNGLFRTEDRVRTSKTDYIAGFDPSTDAISTLPKYTDQNKFIEIIGSPWVSNKIQWTPKFKSIIAVRGDDGKGVLTSFTNPTTLPTNPNTHQSINKFLPGPKASLIFGPWENTEIYLQGGFSYHTNDVRGSSQIYEPVSPDWPFLNCTNNGCNTTPSVPPSQGTSKIAFLAQTKGGEVGVRSAAVPHLQSTVELWYLHSNSELIQDGDTGGTFASPESSNRWGLEVGNYYTPMEHFVLDADFADSRAVFRETDQADSTFMTNPANPQLCPKNSNCYNLIPFNAYDGSAAGSQVTDPNSQYNNAGGYFQQNPNSARFVPEAVRWVVSSGATLQDYKGLSASIRLRYFGPRPLTSDAQYTSPATALVNLSATYKFNRNWSLVGEVLNVLNRRDHDVDYAYVSQIAPAATLLSGSPLATRAPQPTDANYVSELETVANAVNTNAAFTRVMHPVEPIQARFSLRYSFGR